MHRFLLIHGTSHGAWCWRNLLPFLNISGHCVRAIDLPGRGRNPMPFAQITLQSQAECITDALTAPTILVGHSAAGYAITAAAEQDPRHIKGLIYLCAYVPQSGVSLADMRRKGPSQPLRNAIIRHPDNMSFGFEPSLIKEKFYHDCPPETVALATENLCAEAIAPQETALHLTLRSQSLPRAYIRCTEDRAIPPEYQSDMARPMPHVDLPTGHSPFFAAPKRLAETLLAIADQL